MCAVCKALIRYYTNTISLIFHNTLRIVIISILDKTVIVTVNSFTSINNWLRQESRKDITFHSSFFLHVSLPSVRNKWKNLKTISLMSIYLTRKKIIFFSECIMSYKNLAGGFLSMNCFLTWESNHFLWFRSGKSLQSLVRSEVRILNMIQLWGLLQLTCCQEVHFD